MNYFLTMTVDGTIMGVQQCENIEHAAELIVEAFEARGLNVDESDLNFNEMEGHDPSPVWSFTQAADPSTVFEMWWQQAKLSDKRIFAVVPKV